jgi:hypothetical protein
VFGLPGTSQTTDQKHCGLNPLSAWVVHIVTVGFDGAEVKGIAPLACRVRLTPSEFVVPEPVITQGNKSVSIWAET